MTIIVECQECGKKYRMRDDLAGRTLPCKDCGADIRVSGQSSNRRRGSAGMESNQKLLFIAGGVIVVLIAMVAFLLGRSGSSDRNVAVSPIQTEMPNSTVSSPSITASSITPATPPTATPSPKPFAAQTISSKALVETTNSNFPKAAPPVAADIGNKQTNPPEPLGTKSASGPASKGSTWDSNTIPFDDRQGLTFGPSGCPVLVSGNKVWDWKTLKIVQSLEGSYEGRVQTSLSPNGKYFAAANKTPNQQETAVTVWSSESGKQLFVVPGDSKRFADLIVLSNDKLFLGCRLSTQVNVWDLETGKELSPFQPIKSDGVKNSNVGLSLDGKYMALPNHDRLIVVNAETGKEVAFMANPVAYERPRGDATQSIAPSDQPLSKRPKCASNDAVFVYAWLQSLAFSSDAQELAAVSTHPIPHLMAWNNRGQLIYDEPFYAGRRPFWDNAMQWFPDRSAWLIHNDIFDRGASRIVLSIREKFGEDLKVRVADDSHLMGTFPQNPAEVSVIEIPWKQIRASLDSLKKKDAALLSPASPVRVDIQLGDLRGAAEETESTIRQAFASRLSRDGISVSSTGTAVFKIRFAETPGDTLPIYERQSPFDFRGQDTGRRATEAKGKLVVELILPGRETPIWRDTIEAQSSRSFREGINDASIRKSMLQNLAFNIFDLNFPYFIPQSEQLIALPVVIQ